MSYDQACATVNLNRIYAAQRAAEPPNTYGGWVFTWCACCLYGLAAVLWSAPGADKLWVFPLALAVYLGIAFYRWRLKVEREATAAWTASRRQAATGETPPAPATTWHWQTGAGYQAGSASMPPEEPAPNYAGQLAIEPPRG
jgi:hypothetical protein